MSAEEYRREAETDPEYRDWLARRQQQTEDELQRLKAEQRQLEEVLQGSAFTCKACGGTSYETGFVTDDDSLDWHVRCTRCGAVHTARIDGAA
jgi:transcription elongation factor Elf1